MSIWAAVSCYAFVSTCGLLWCVDSQLPPNVLQSIVHTVRSLSQGAASDDFRAALKAGDVFLKALLESHLTAFWFFNFVTSFYLSSAVTLKAVFLGQLTVIESAKLTERLLKYIMLKVVFVGAVVPPTLPEIAKWLSWFMIMGYLKMFLGMARDRLEGLLSSPSASVLSIVRATALLALVLVNDLTWLGTYMQPSKNLSTNEMLLWLFDAFIIGVEAVHTVLKFGVQMASRVQDWYVEQSGSSLSGQHMSLWEEQGSFLYHCDLLSDLLIHTLTLAHYWHIWYLHGVALQVIDFLLFFDIRALVVGLHHRLRGYCHYWSATSRLQHSFQDATAEQLLDCGDCAICREAMTSAKVLPCSHIFHLGCLRAWLQQSGMNNFTCPLCRAPLLPKDSGRYPNRPPTPRPVGPPLTPVQWGNSWQAGVFQFDQWLQVGHAVQLQVQPGMHPYDMSAEIQEHEDGSGGEPSVSHSGHHYSSDDDQPSTSQSGRAIAGTPLPATPSTVSGSLACRSYYSLAAASISSQHNCRRRSSRHRHSNDNDDDADADPNEVSSSLRSGCSQPSRRQSSHLINHGGPSSSHQSGGASQGSQRRTTPRRPTESSC